MMSIHTISAIKQLTCEQRMSEVGDILATGLQRLWENSESEYGQGKNNIQTAKKREGSLAISAQESVHGTTQLNDL